MLAGPVLVTVRSNALTVVATEKLLLPWLPAGSLVGGVVMATVLVTLGAAAGATATWKVIAFGLLPPAAMTVLLEHTTRPPPTMLSPATGVLAVHVQPVPEGTTAIVRPVGSVSVIVYV